MATFLMLGKYSNEGVKGATAARTKKIVSMIEKGGGKLTGIYALLGQFDLAFLAEFPGVPEAMQASFAISKATGIAFSTLPALPVEEFDKLISG